MNKVKIKLLIIFFLKIKNKKNTIILQNDYLSQEWKLNSGLSPKYAFMCVCVI